MRLFSPPFACFLALLFLDGFFFNAILDQCNRALFPMKKFLFIALLLRSISGYCDPWPTVVQPQALVGIPGLLYKDQIYPLQILALSGSSEAALRLYNSYARHPNTLSEAVLWARIAAQNGTDFAQYNYGQSLLPSDAPSSPDELSHFPVPTRAKFWLCLPQKNNPTSHPTEFYKKAPGEAEAMSICGPHNEKHSWPDEQARQNHNDTTKTMDLALAGSRSDAYYLSKKSWPNLEQKIYWTEISSENGETRSWSDLGQMLATRVDISGAGSPTKLSAIRARFWFCKSIASGDLSAKQNLYELNKTLPALSEEQEKKYQTALYLPPFVDSCHKAPNN